MKKKFTVVLLRPKYAADRFGKDIYSAWVEAEGLQEAIAYARRQVLEADGDSGALPMDYYVLLVYKGHQQSLI